VRTIAVVLAGGTGTRVGQDRPKQLVEVAGKPLIEHTIKALHDVEVIDEIVVAMTPGYTEEVRALLGDRYPKVSSVIDGGPTRADTSRLALDLLNETAWAGEDVNVLLHDAARPFVDARIVEDCVRALATYEAVCVAIPVSDTLLEIDNADEGERVVSIPARTRFRRAQTPQAFRLSTIRQAYALAAADPAFSATDDSSVVLSYLPATPIHVVPGDERNVKITHPIDLLLAQAVIDGDR
jgi:2-C-methyl-D-erythritol 4-phosphate cytidylyltransferase